MQSVLRSSEFWLSVIGALAVGGAKAGLWSQADFDQFIAPALTYVVARLISKLAKAGVAPKA